MFFPFYAQPYITAHFYFAIFHSWVGMQASVGAKIFLTLYIAHIG